MRTKLLVNNTTGMTWWQGVDYGPRAKVLAKNDDFMAVNVPGHTYASGQMRPYAPATNYVFEIVSQTPWGDDCTQYELDQRLEWVRSPSAAEVK